MALGTGMVMPQGPRVHLLGSRCETDFSSLLFQPLNVHKGVLKLNLGLPCALWAFWIWKCQMPEPVPSQLCSWTSSPGQRIFRVKWALYIFFFYLNICFSALAAHRVIQANKLNPLSKREQYLASLIFNGLLPTIHDLQHFKTCRLS